MRVVVRQAAALARARERRRERDRREESDDPVVAAQEAAAARQRERYRERWMDRNRREQDHERWLEQAIATLYTRLDERRQASPPRRRAAENAVAEALRELVAHPDGAGFVGQCLELDPVEVRRLVGPLHVS
jgi:hypothetical protein